MSHNSRYKAGPTLAQCRKAGVTHLELQCLNSRCRNLRRLELHDVRARDDVPVNEVRWVCSGCRGINISVSTVRPGAIVTPEPIFDTSNVIPSPRRKVRAG